MSFLAGVRCLQATSPNAWLPALFEIRQVDKQEGLSPGRAASVMPHLNTSDCSKTSLVKKLATSPEMEEGSSSKSLSSCHSAGMQRAKFKQAGTAPGPRAAERLNF